jgi:hypothetical protein
MGEQRYIVVGCEGLQADVSACLLGYELNSALG